MGLFKDLRTITKQAKEIERSSPGVKDSLATGTARMSAANAMMASMAQGGAQASAAITNGVAAVATITAARQTGALINFSPVVELELLIMLPSGVPMQATRQEQVDQLNLGRCQPGMRLNVKVDPINANNLWIDWATPVY
ncbi:MAG TPA: hypothetical protein PK020_13820 [Ilumatobacteraceae bacterium]|nr:hypothetical protein [Ilumatobacteraceae bacterium]